MQDWSAAMFTFSMSENNRGNFRFQVSGKFSEMIIVFFFFRFLDAKVRVQLILVAFNIQNIAFRR